jgi:hypothetical protein
MRLYRQEESHSIAQQCIELKQWRRRGVEHFDRATLKGN